jgi:hypothetical protein
MRVMIAAAFLLSGSLAMLAGEIFAVPVPEPGWPYQTGYSVSQSGTAAQLDADPALEIAIASQDKKVYVLNHDGTLVPGWPKIMGDALGPDDWVNQCSSPAVADLDLDGVPEVIVGNFDAKLYVFEPDGTPVAGFPFQVGWMIFSTPSAGNIDADPELEIVFGANDGKIWALNANGTVCAGFPYATPYVIRSSPALGDLDGDGVLEIACTADNSSYQLYVLRGNGTNMPGFPKVLWQSGAISSPAMGDMDADGDLEIAAGARDGTIHVFHHDGSPLAGWPVDAGYSCESSPTLANLDGDPELELVVGMNDSKVCAFEHDGTPMPGWPRATTYTVKSSAVIGDIDADGDLEIVIGENTGLVYAWNVDGSPVPGFPLEDPTYTIYSSPLLEDLDRDGSLELLVGCNDTRIYCWDLGTGTYRPDLLPWADWRRDGVNSACVPVLDPAGVAEASACVRDGLHVAPNPSGTWTRIEWTVPDPEGPMDLAIHDASGRLLRVLVAADGGPRGARAVVWDGRDAAGRPVAPGCYLAVPVGATEKGGTRVLRVR